MSPQQLRDELQLEAVGKGANVLLMTPPEADNTDAGGVFYQSRKLTNGLTGVNPVQLYVDFTLHGSRGQEQADFLIEHALGFREKWPAKSTSRKTFLPPREKAVLLELLNVMRALKNENIDAIVCGGWVPFLKELARDSQTRHSMSFDIDVLLRAKAREREAVDRIKALLAKSLAYAPNKDASFRYEKAVDGNIVQLDLLTDLPRIKKTNPFSKSMARIALSTCASWTAPKI